jgi:Flp pilus assembly protein protease CpaA
MLLEILLFAILAWISIYDFRNHQIRNIDLLILLTIMLFRYSKNIGMALFGVFLYLFLNLISGGRIGAGDVKLSFVLALFFDSFEELLSSICIAWIIGGFFALICRVKTLPFAPFMIFGTYLVRFV